MFFIHIFLSVGSKIQGVGSNLFIKSSIPHSPIRKIFLPILLLCLLAINPQVSANAGATSLFAPPLPAPSGNIINVATESQLQFAIDNLHSGDTIVLASGHYKLTKTLSISENNITVRGATDNCDDVVISGLGMENKNYGKVRNGIWTDAANLKIFNLTIRDIYFHLVQFDPKADSPHLYNLKLYNSGEQFIKASSGGFGVGVDYGVVEYTIMEYTEGVPNTDHGGGTGYTNGVDVHGGKNWVIRNNVFKNFHTPDNADHLWNPAILMWNGATGTVSEGNIFINVDRAIAYGLVDRDKDHSGGVIRNNMIYYSPGLYGLLRKFGSDGAIIIWDSPGTHTYHNTVLTNGNLNKSIEYRFGDTRGGTVKNNLVDAPISTRSGATFLAEGNMLTAAMSMFVDPEVGNLHLKKSVLPTINQVDTVIDALVDIDGQSRSLGSKGEVGADEISGVVSF